MESESSGMPDDTSFTQNAARWDVTSHEEMTCDHNVHHADMDSYGDEFKTSQGRICETIDNRDMMSSVKKEQESSNSFESCVVVVSDEDVAEGMCFSPSYICKDLSSVFNHKNSSPVSNGEHLRLNSTKETFRFHNRDDLPDLSDEDIPSAVNQEEWCYHDLYQDVCPAFQQPEEQVALHLSRVDASQLLHFLST